MQTSRQASPRPTRVERRAVARPSTRRCESGCADAPTPCARRQLAAWRSRWLAARSNTRGEIERDSFACSSSVATCVSAPPIQRLIRGDSGRGRGLSIFQGGRIGGLGTADFSTDRVQRVDHCHETAGGREERDWNAPVGQRIQGLRGELSRSANRC
jgi:hypothetical protein